MPGTAPYGFENDVERNEHGWFVWKTSCPECKATVDEDGEKLMALNCPTCERPGCDECMPCGRGCECPSCEEGWED